ncbi:MAG: M48 family metallopeptidase [Bacteroidia bacterium]|nr:M48 family metallopeptidase [Bacteroidia bacterium]
MRDSIQFGSQIIEFWVTFSDRKTLGITITPEMEVKVNAPLGAEMGQIKKKLLGKSPWILKQLSFFLSFQPRTTPRKYVGGETHLYLGRQYRLKVDLGEQEWVKLRGKFIWVQAQSKSRVKELVDGWYLAHARVKIPQIAQPLIEKFRSFGVEPASVVLREMPKRWGSCTPRGKIMLNPELIKAPRGCIEYVIVHELCHLIHPDHSRRFFELQSREMPDWEVWKGKLESLLA